MANSKYGKLLYIATSIFLSLLGVAFIVCFAHLFFTGGSTPYSRERVTDYLTVLLIPSIITVLLIIGGFVYDALTNAKKDNSVGRTNLEILGGYSKRVDIDALSQSARESVIKERDRRELFAWLAGDATLLFIVGAVLYFRFCTNFSVENLNADVVSALSGLLPLLIGSIAVHVPKAYLTEQSAKRELQILKDEVKGGVKLAKVEPVAETKCEKLTILIARIAIICVGVLFIILGIFNGGMADVLAKAVKICTECIGLG